MSIPLHHAKDALNAYCNSRGTINAPDEDITDLITDLLHLLDTYEGLPAVRVVLEHVQSHYADETEGR